jgi:predicted nucleic acid-binding protein
MAPAFFDTNVILYLGTDDEAKAVRAEELLAEGGVLSVQVLNEFVSVSAQNTGGLGQRSKKLSRRCALSVALSRSASPFTRAQWLSRAAMAFRSTMPSSSRAHALPAAIRCSRRICSTAV